MRTLRVIEYMDWEGEVCVPGTCLSENFLHKLPGGKFSVWWVFVIVCQKETISHFRSAGTIKALPPQCARHNRHQTNVEVSSIAFHCSRDY
jgi:hypothetical protein